MEKNTWLVTLKPCRLNGRVCAVESSRCTVCDTNARPGHYFYHFPNVGVLRSINCNANHGRIHCNDKNDAHIHSLGKGRHPPLPNFTPVSPMYINVSHTESLIKDFERSFHIFHWFSHTLWLYNGSYHGMTVSFHVTKVPP